MLRSFSRLTAVAVVGATIIAGGVLAAPAANAATPKARYAVATEVLPIGSGYDESNYHNVRFTARHVGNETIRFEGETVYKNYSVRLHRGKHDLLVVKKTSFLRAMYMGGVTPFRPGASKSDAALVKAEKHTLKLPYATIKARLVGVAGSSRQAQVKSDVRNTVDNVLTAQALGTPSDYAVANSHVNGTETVVVTWVDEENFTVVGTDVYDHYYYKYDSRTGLFTGGKA
jgi:hypothetical protein